MGDFAKAAAAYDGALKIEPNHARALFGRGIAKIRSGDKSGGDADLAAALKIDPKIGADFTKFGFN